MPFLFTCPHCQTSTQVEDCYSGHEGACVTCGKPIKIPEFDVSRAASSQKRSKYSVSMVIGTVLAILVIFSLGFLLIRSGDRVMQRMSNNRGVSESVSNLRKIVAALNAYASDHGTYPPSVMTVGRNKHSWRVLILPYLQENQLYDQYDLEQPWDSETNMAVAYQFPAVFQNQRLPRTDAVQHSDYFLVTGPGTLFPSSGPLSPTDVTDDPGQTLLLVEARSMGNWGSVWTEPIDFNVESLSVKGFNELGGVLENGFAAGTVDGKGHFISKSTEPAVISALFTANGGERLSDDVLD